MGVQLEVYTDPHVRERERYEAQIAELTRQMESSRIDYDCFTTLALHTIKEQEAEILSLYEETPRVISAKCPCPFRCNYCGAKRRRDAVGHYCPTKNCQWEHGYSCCDLDTVRKGAV